MRRIQSIQDIKESKNICARREQRTEMTGDAVADRIEENRQRSRQEVGGDRQLVARTGKITNRKLSSQAKKVGTGNSIRTGKDVSGER